MKISLPVVLLLLACSTLASLEPLGYKVPETNYLPPQQQKNPYQGFKTPSNHYIPSTTNYYKFEQDNNFYGAPQNSNTYKTLSSSSDSYKTSSSSSDSYNYPKSKWNNAKHVLPTTSYGAPDYISAKSHGYSYSRHQENQWDEPAKYNFDYKVKNNFGNDFGHQESRDGSKTRGRYHVLLPDGRKQIVEYEADEAGYRPKITYEKSTGGNQFTADRVAYPGAPY